MSDSFRNNVSILAEHINEITKAVELYDDSKLVALQDLLKYDLDKIYVDLAKGNYLGNRKIDIDLSLNKNSTDSVVSYSQADITLVSGSIISIPFLSGSSVLELTSHNDIRNYIVNDALWAGIQYTECTVEESTATTPTLIRFRDADGHSSNIERVELTVYSGTAQNIKPVYFWAQTTSALQTIANRVGDIIALGNNMGNVIELSQRVDELNELQAELTNLLEIHSNLAEILQADTNAGIATTKAAEALASKTAALQALSDATTQATIATNQAIIATTKANEIKSITTQTTTGAAGSLAQVSYNSTDGKLSFVVPQGLKGDRGEAFSVNAMGTFAQRTGYDAQPINFSYFATDMSLIYFKQSATSGDWSTGIPFGKGDKGDTGLTGNGISTITKISGTGAAGSADTYRITYTSGGTFDFTVWNGTESVISVAGKSGTVTLVKADVGLGNVDNTTDLLKPLSTATTNALALKANDSTVVHKTGDETVAGIKTFSSSPVVPTPTANTQAANKAYADTKQANLGFTPVQQGTGIGQLSNVVKIGWSGARTKITIDTTDIGNIVMDSDIGVANSSLVKTALNASGSAPIYACRTWVNFNGTSTVAIRGSGNVSSITDNGVGNYTVNFITAFYDLNYSLIGTTQGSVGHFGINYFNALNANITVANSTSANMVDSSIICVSVFR